MTQISTASLQAFLAFESASIAVCEINELARKRQPSNRANDLLVELRSAHVRLRELFRRRARRCRLCPCP
jgi:hypothetical protein